MDLNRKPLIIREDFRGLAPYRAKPKPLTF